MDANEASTFMSERYCEVVALVGAVKSGKTTLVAAVWEILHKGALCGWKFCGSRTMVGFENRCYLGRSESERNVPDTERTSQFEPGRFLHLELAKAGIRRNLLIHDVTGESYEAALVSAEACRKLDILPRATSVTVIVDGAKVGAVTSRVAESTNVQRLIARCLDNGAIAPSAQLTIAVSKWDHLSAANDNTTGEFIAQMERQCRGKFQSRVRTFQFCNIASRSGSEEIVLGHGMEPLISSWLDNVSLAPGKAPPASGTGMAGFRHTAMEEAECL